MSDGARAPRIMLVVGEPSGDLLGAQIILALRKLTGGHVELSGVGGPVMEAEGFESLFPITDTSVMGFREVVPKIPRILARVRQASDFAEKTKPDAVVLIDSPDFTHRIGRRLSKRAPDIPIVKYVAPQVWASRPGRAKAMASFVDHLLCLLPFEPGFFEDYGIDARFVGHPVTERITKGDGAAFRARHGIDEATPLLCVLPGSRSSEVRFILPEFRETMIRLKDLVPNLQTVIVTVDHVAEMVRARTTDWPLPLTIVGQGEKADAFAASDAALAASGTVSTELALAEVPMVIGYKLGWFTYWIFKRLIVSPYMSLINLIERKAVIPEYAQESLTPEDLAEEIERLLTDNTAAAEQVAGYRSALEAMGLGAAPPSERAAQAILDIVSAKAA